MRIFRAKSPYTKEGKSNFRYTSGKPGVYLIYRNQKLVYVGMSQTNVYRTMHRHFQKWNDPTQIRVTYNPNGRSVFACRVVLCSAAQAIKLEKMLILKHKPKDNPLKYESYKPTKADKQIIDDYFGTPLEYAPF